jgi:hypothetical protein
MIIDLDSAERKKESRDPQQESPKPSEILMYLEMGIAIAAIMGLLALGASIACLANHDWTSSIQRFQEMI